jgi:hypothetical protein
MPKEIRLKFTIRVALSALIDVANFLALSTSFVPIGTHTSGCSFRKGQLAKITERTAQNLSAAVKFAIKVIAGNGKKRRCVVRRSTVDALQSKEAGGNDKHFYLLLFCQRATTVDCQLRSAIRRSFS